ncbi:MAG: dihydropteroate synthase [Acidimicrobiia bacterium]
MGVVNLTPDSFSDGGRITSPQEGLAHARRLIEEGADLLDLGGESTRPGAEAVSAEVEIERVMPVLAALVADGTPLSIDTSKPEVARVALAAGAEAINDVTSGSHPEMFPVVADTGAGLVLMHMQGNPPNMQTEPRYVDVVAEIKTFLAERAAAAQNQGVTADRIALDPGIGFGKTLEHNLTLIRNLSALQALGFPVVLGASRKKFLGLITGVDDPAQRDLASAVIAALGVERGADILRVHNVAACREAVAVAIAIVRESGG